MTDREYTAGKARVNAKWIVFHAAQLRADATEQAHGEAMLAQAVAKREWVVEMVTFSDRVTADREAAVIP